MRARAMATAGLLAGGAVMAGPTAWAGELDLNLTPRRAAPGQEITIEGGCDRNQDNRVSFVSTALELTPANINSDGQFSVTGTVAYHVRPGKTYKVTATCNRSQSSETATFYVKRERHETYPRGGPRTGGGGAAEEAFSGSWTSGGLALLLGAGLIGAFTFYRSRSRGRA